MHFKELINQIASSGIQNFILKHAMDDVARLALKHKVIEGVPFPEVGNQIIARQKAKNKIPLWYNTPGIVYPPPISMEQSSSEATAQYKISLFPEGCSLADFTGGFGVDAYFYSTRASYVRYIERQENLCCLAEHNFETLGSRNIQVVNSDLSDYLPVWLSNPTDYIYIDPARRNVNQKKVFLLEDCEPFLGDILPLVLPHCHGMMAKLSPLFDVNLLLKDWGDIIQHIHVVSVKNECRELLVVFSQEAEDCGITCVNLEQDQLQQTFTYDQIHKSPKIIISAPREWLYEPNASIMKAGIFDVTGSRFGLNKLHKNSHLYTSEKLVEDFPGRQFKILTITSADKKELEKAVPGKKANISTRNFPLSPEELYKKTGFKTGGDIYLFGTTLADKSKVIIVCKKAR